VSWGYHRPSALREAGADMVIDDFAALFSALGDRSTRIMTGWKVKRFWTDATVVQDASRVACPARQSSPTHPCQGRVWTCQPRRWPAPLPLNGRRKGRRSTPCPCLSRVPPIRPSTGWQRSMARWRTCWPPMPKLICCATVPTPLRLCEQQAAAWDPLLDWAEQRFGARLVPTTGILPVAQPEPALRRLSDTVHGMDAFRLTALHDLVSLSGSLSWGLRWPGAARPGRRAGGSAGSTRTGKSPNGARMKKPPRLPPGNTRNSCTRSDSGR
jgi:hypothetical protein